MIDSEDEKVFVNVAVILRSTWKGKSHTFRLHGYYVENAFIASDGTGIMLTSHHYEKYRQDNYLYKFTNNFSECKLISRKVGSISVNPNRVLWEGCQVGRKEGAMEKLDDGRQVYVNWLYTGNWKTGQQWTVAKGLVDVDAVQFRPLK